MALTFLLTTLWSVEVGVAVSVTISLLLVVHRSSRARMSILVGYNLAYNTELILEWIKQGRVPGTDKWEPIQENPDAQEAVPGVLIIRIRESLDFGMRFAPAFEAPLTPLSNSKHHTAQGCV